MTFRVALCQMNSVPGDVPGNLARIRAFIAEAERAGAELALFPELCVVGYGSRDVLFRRRFEEAAGAAVAEIATLARTMTVVVGSFRRNPDTHGRPFVNEAVVCHGGRIVSRVQKTLLPAYDVFDEARYFEPARSTAPVDIGGRRLGILVCEDLWSDPVDHEATGYPRSPAQELAAAGAKWLLNISASPWHRAKADLRESVLAQTATAAGIPVALVNVVGGNDDVLFDGRSVALDRRGAVIGRGMAFSESVTVVDLDADGGGISPLPDPSDPRELHDALVMGLGDFARKSGFREAHLGLSGGIDSTLVAVLAVDALGPDHVRGFALPSRYSSQGSLDDAYDLARRLRIRCDTLPIEPAFVSTLTTLDPLMGPRESGVTEENIQARLRGLLLMAFANSSGSVLLSTGNKSELAVGYCTLYGDMCGGLAVISDVWKTDVYRLARRIAETRGTIPPACITKPPSAELRPNQTDQDSLPPYDVLDAILQAHLEDNLGVRDIVALGFDGPTVRRVVGLVARSEFKRHQAPPGLRVSRKAFGQGRRMPIAASALDWLDAPEGTR